MGERDCFLKNYLREEYFWTKKPLYLLLPQIAFMVVFLI